MKISAEKMEFRNTADEAQVALNQLEKGEKTINEVRECYGLHPLSVTSPNTLLTKE